MSRSKDILKMMALVGVAGAVCSLTPSCRDNNESIFIRQVQALALPDCVAKNDPTATFISRGLLDVALSSRYSVAVLIGNQLVARGDFKQTRAEPNRVLITGADITLTDASGAQVLGSPYSVTATGEADPQNNGDATYGLASFELIPPSVAVNNITPLLLGAIHSGKNAVESYEARFKVYGQTLGGTNVETGEFAYDIDVCYGCTIFFPAAEFDPTQAPNDVNCKKASTSTTAPTGVTLACLAGQDGETDCGTCQGNPVCTPCLKTQDCTDAGTPGTCLFNHCIPN